MADKHIFNIEQLMQSTADDKELAGQVVEVFLSDIPNQLAELDQALGQGDAKTAERAAHSIKGASAMVGGEALRQIALDCEAHGREGDLASLQGKVVELKYAFACLENELRDNGFA